MATTKVALTLERRRLAEECAKLDAAAEQALVEEGLGVDGGMQRTSLAQLNDAYAQAAVDPTFLAEMDRISVAFEQTASDGLSSAEPVSR